MAKRILWMSQHEPLPSQLAALAAMFGTDVVVEKDPRPFDSAEIIVRRFRSGGFDDLVVVAPLSVIDHLVRNGVKPLWAEMVETRDRREAEIWFDRRRSGYYFDRFRRVKRVAVEFEN
ncbi:MAG: hypothetical protein WC702_02880 [Patescibacteria group bacterium]|jgi:hypothetical protein